MNWPEDSTRERPLDEYTAIGADAATYAVRVTCSLGRLIGGKLKVVQSGAEL